MRKGLMLAAASVFVLSACQRAEKAAPGNPTADAAIESAAPATDLAVDQSAPPAISAPLAPVASIAFTYRYALSLPRDQGAEVMSRHEQTCASAGPGLCQVISAQADWVSRDPGGRLEMRGQPEWINRFRAGLATDARHVAAASGATLVLDLAALPLAPGVAEVAAALGEDPQAFAATAGEDYELCACGPAATLTAAGLRAPGALSGGSGSPSHPRRIMASATSRGSTT